MDGGDQHSPIQAQSPPASSPIPAPEPTPKNVPPLKVKGPRRRTKTGCLTCRKRRIKCGEEKPTCNNCKKSKRECEGYAQRVIFRNPVGPMSHLSHGPIPQSYTQPGTEADPLPFLRRPIGSTGSRPEGSGTRAPFIPLAPRPNQDATSAAHGESQHTSVPEHQPLQLSPNRNSSQDQHDFYSEFYNFQSTKGTGLPLSETLQQTPQHALDTRLELPSPQRSLDNTFLGDYKPSGIISKQMAHQFYMSSGQPQPEHRFHVSYKFSTLNRLIGTDEGQPSTNKFEPASVENYTLGFPDRNAGQPANYFYEDEIDDYYDVQTDEEMDIQTYSYPQPYETEVPQSTATQLIHPFRSNTAFLNDESSLTSYTPSPFASPLMDPEVTRIFCHFITSVAPVLSIFERHPVNPTVILSTAPIPPSQQSLWTYTLPTLALRNQALLHAILALSSHHIAKMQGSSLVASFRHYHYALRRISKAVKLPGRRKQTATLAATLLLGFYEVMGAEHSKWNSHVAGASQLIQEVDFAGMTRDIRSMRARARQEHMQLAQSMPWMGMIAPQIGSRFENDLFADKEAETDDELISTLMGRPMSYNDFGTVRGARPMTASERNLTAGDIEEYRIRSDLYWWYCKQDAYQSMIGGNPLLMPFNIWGACPPRSGIGKLDAVYGSFDHLVLLLARTVDFVSRDRARKVKVIKRNGGQWCPPPGFFPSGMGRGGPGAPPGPQHGPPTRRPAAPSSSNYNRENSPPMYGMIPNVGPARLPSGFAETSLPTLPSKPEPEINDLDGQTAKAEAEWKELLAAYEACEKAFGPSFAPLQPDSAPPIATPFGPALQYRTHTVACVWAFYYTGRIILERTHPSMPPESMVAAGVCAFRTAHFANSIGRIIAGIYYPQQFDGGTVSLNPSILGVLTELMIPLFFSGVQYTDPAQRGWTIAKLRNIARLSSISSATSVASGCETAWIQAYEAGKGPPYQRTMNPMTHVDMGQGTVSRLAGERKFVTVNRSTSVTWAMGLLSLQGDYSRVDEIGEEEVAS
ncbi:hypothetical protein PAAG_03678 [Paracoccidioides lutzii Pb01]|uniref:Zn(2)-C6 fungal-type domain-containing protein n=1 Tax=Paracoccidioides lutzii (strain ATCC MYA-826 / Pb01) TaxID=502779 RepID=C1GYT4_PARBA|nr:hypothetical protein PAAG_03678 [Paracoccidioides lutzii Pb01]EEH41757.2 hypothetical protein PAAG_03678 [Paracoccidioides lutzii Pb01]